MVEGKPGRAGVGTIIYDTELIEDLVVVRATGRVVSLAVYPERLTAELSASREQVRVHGPGSWPGRLLSVHLSIVGVDAPGRGLPQIPAGDCRCFLSVAVVARHDPHRVFSSGQSIGSCWISRCSPYRAVGVRLDP